MSLFQTQKDSKSADALTTAHPMPPCGMVMGRKVSILAFINGLMPNGAIHFITEGKWSSHELLSCILDLTGAACVRISTYSMTEDPVRMLVNYVHDGRISDLKVITDKRFRGQQGAAHQLAVANFPVILTDVHAKVMVVRNEKWNVVVVGSANFTRNKRNESGIVLDNKEAADFYWNWIDAK